MFQVTTLLTPAGKEQNQTFDAVIANHVLVTL